MQRLKDLMQTLWRYAEFGIVGPWCWIRRSPMNSAIEAPYWSGCSDGATLRPATTEPLRSILTTFWRTTRNLRLEAARRGVDARRLCLPRISPALGGNEPKNGAQSSGGSVV